MINTYINDNATVAYPLYGTGYLPFSMSVITGMGVCVLGADSSDPIYLSSVTIARDAVDVVICRGGTMLGSMRATLTDPKAESKIRVFTDTLLSGYLTLGSITEKDIGSYTGVFYIDPSCIMYLPEAVRAGHTELQINNKYYSIGDVLNITAEGLLTFAPSSESKIPILEGKPETDTAVMTTVSGTGGYAMVSSINNIEPIAVGDSKGQLVVDTIHPEVISLSIDASAATVSDPSDTGGGTGGVVLLIIEGTKKFPNCYDENEDEAQGVL